ncbi:shikimate dehydrogenase [Streptomyces ipomoeae]|uniref:shikimate dehydrogenase n=1 Tax=Streptomyces ipomoeae TaxID=103232 RepID=UPI0011478CEE|nr:shikimate dehydrogenase [Streptomyces ipomoeae]MDX2934621.1 shikimate dehydrogenase [Streptomyces ipomoeae]TQE19017.1 shikimate dehydrogenase [Streptomyces ipomoeae]
MRADQKPAAGRTTARDDSGSRVAVLGSPVGDSLWPTLHRAAYAAMGLDWKYEAFECDEPGLPGLFDSLGGDWAGLCLTMPLGRAVLPLVDEVSDLALDVGGADTVVFRHGRSFGDHTGVHGITTALRQAGLEAPGSAVVLGGRATACSALAALRELGVREPIVVVRERSRAMEVEAAAGRLGVSVDVRRFDELDRLLRGVAVVVSTLPAGAADTLASTVARSGAAVLDAVCSAFPTRLAKAAGFVGSTVVDGLSMLLHQTVRQTELLTGLTDVPVAALRGAARAELLRRAAREAEPAGSR